MQNFDICSMYKLEAEIYSLTLTHSSQSTLPMPIVTNKRIMGVMIVDAAFPSTSGAEDYLIAMSWDLDSNGKVRVTPTFTNAVSASAQVVVLYKD